MREPGNEVAFGFNFGYRSVGPCLVKVRRGSLAKKTLFDGQVSSILCFAFLLYDMSIMPCYAKSWTWLSSINETIENGRNEFWLNLEAHGQL